MKKRDPIKIAPSILAGNFGYLADEAKRAEDAGADTFISISWMAILCQICQWGRKLLQPLIERQICF